MNIKKKINGLLNIYMPLHILIVSLCIPFYLISAGFLPFKKHIHPAEMIAASTALLFPLTPFVSFQILKWERASQSRFRWIGILDLALWGFQFVLLTPGYL